MMMYLVAYGVTGVAFLGLDAIWLSTMSKLLYRPLLGGLLADQVNVAPAIAFYAIYIAGIVFFAVAPALSDTRWTTALLRAAALGLVAYATYDLTNMATLKNWPALITWADLAWGTAATAIAATIGYAAAVRLA